MKVKEGFILREIAGGYIVVPVGTAAKNFNGMITLNGTGAFLFKLALNSVDEREFATALSTEYGIDEEKALVDARAFIQKLAEAELLK